MSRHCSRWALAWIGLAAGLFAGWAGPARAQFAHQEKFVRPFLRRLDADGYLNYARDKYSPYQLGLDSFKKFDILGDFLVEGTTIYRWEEQRPGRGRGAPNFGELHDGSLRGVHGHWRFWFNFLMQFDDSLRDFRWRLTAGDFVRTHLTSLTFSVPKFSGIRYDVSSPKHQLTVLYTIGRPTWRTDYDRFWGGKVGTAVFLNPFERQAHVGVTPFLGTHWRTQVGDAVALGATFVNQHAEDVTSESGIASLRGGLPYPMLPPTQVVLTFADDSPGDGRGGAAVFGVPRVTILTEGDSLLTRFIPARFGGAAVGDHVEANGFEEMTFTYDMPLSPTPVAMVVEATVANDYRISISQNHRLFTPRSKQLDEFGNQLPFEERSTEPYVMTRAPDNVQDLSNKATIRFRYGLATGQMIYGTDFSADFSGLKARGEIALSSTYMQFPTRRGEQVSPLRGAAYFLNVLKEAGPFNLGFEYFHMGPKYASYMGTRGGPTLYTDTGGTSNELAQTVEFPWMDDNDDGDQWSDDDILHEIIGRDNIGQDKGVYPGRDEDFDGHIDDDRNSNLIPDWTEPFLLYYSDPLEFTYGLDGNNNLWVDQWEDDERPDYPYDTDLEGPHYLAEYQPTEHLKLSAGVFDTREIAGGGENRGRYFRTAYTLDRGDIGRIEWYHDTKRVRDSIRNSVYLYGDIPNFAGPQPGEPGYDTLEMRNSLVNTAFLGTQYNQLLNLHVENNFKLLQNHRLPERFEDGSEQPDARVTQFLMINRADYRLRLGRWSLWPQLKRLVVIGQENPKAGARVVRRSESWTAPIVRVDFHATPNTVIRFGQQGLRAPWLNQLFDNLGLNRERARNLLAFQYRDKVNARRSFSSSDLVVMIQSKSEYFGYGTMASVGFHRRRSEFRDRDSRFLDERLSRFFIELVGAY